MDIKTLRELDEQLRIATNAMKSFEATLAACDDVKLQCLVNACSSTDLERASDALWMVAEQQFDLQIKKSTILQPVSSSTRNCNSKHSVIIEDFEICFCCECMGFSRNP